MTMGICLQTTFDINNECKLFIYDRKLSCKFSEVVASAILLRYLGDQVFMCHYLTYGRCGVFYKANHCW